GGAADREEIANDRAGWNGGDIEGMVGAIRRHPEVELCATVDLIVDVGPRGVVDPELHTAARRDGDSRRGGGGLGGHEQRDRESDRECDGAYCGLHPGRTIDVHGCLRWP